VSTDHLVASISVRDRAAHIPTMQTSTSAAAAAAVLIRLRLFDDEGDADESAERLQHGTAPGDSRRLTAATGRFQLPLPPCSSGSGPVFTGTLLKMYLPWSSSNGEQPRAAKFSPTGREWPNSTKIRHRRAGRLLCVNSYRRDGCLKRANLSETRRSHRRRLERSQSKY